MSHVDIEVTPGNHLWAWRSKMDKPQWGTEAWAKATSENQSAISTAIQDALSCGVSGGNQYLACVTAFYQEAFDKDSSMKLKLCDSAQGDSPQIAARGGSECLGCSSSCY